MINKKIDKRERELCIKGIYGEYEWQYVSEINKALSSLKGIIM